MTHASLRSLPPPLGRPSRRGLLRGAAGLGAAVALGGSAACGSAASLAGGDRRIQFWNLFSGGDGANMRGMLDRFRAEFPGIEVEDTTLAWGDRYYTKLAMAGAGGRAPDVGILHLGRLAGFAPGRLLDPIDTGLLAEAGVRREDFNATLWDRATIGGELYGLPLDIHPSTMFYNRAACEPAGLLDAEGRLTELNGTEQFLDALDAVREVIGQSPLGWNALMPGECWWTFVGLYAQTGGSILSEDGTELALDDDRAEEVLAFMARLVADEYAIPGQDLVGYFVNGGGFVLFGNWLLVDFRTAGLDFGARPYPTLFGTPATQAESHILVLPHQEGRSGAADEAAHTLIAWLVRNSLSWAEASHVPAYLPILEHPDYLAMEPQSEYRGAMDIAAFDPPAWFCGTSSRVQADVGVHLSAAAMGSVTPAEAVRDIRATLRSLLDTRNPFGEGTAS
ncbi:extracellular solute-binding protein [Streptomyces sp. MP131-18]|uniref:extracellular solute-binding protein n=1 Tax=Streptomyces sp. MP131-18 TaxID=1857892 RepID=UPI00097BFE3E|nr:extracellular solute-binding protein [Streptomyces sp. MP131-18]ONK14654.1 Maltodextrin-binding protein MdxE precursor [Streptomyces sp. MP131-18]